jgi:MSHA biogenesis protein MshQ
MKNTMRFGILQIVALIATFLLTIENASATTLTTVINADDEFDIYISTNPSVAGTLFGSGFGWGTTFTSSTLLTPGFTNYIHVWVKDVGFAISGLLGEFTLNDNAFQFDNLSQILLTNTTNWLVTSAQPLSVLYSIPTLTPISHGVNGVAPWGLMVGNNSSAQWIWEPSNSANQNGAWFSARISQIPEPSSMSLVGLGFAGVALSRRKRGRAGAGLELVRRNL